MEEALRADGHGFLEEHDALIGLAAEELQGGEAAGRRHVEMLPAARGYDKAFCCAHVGVPPCGGMRIKRRPHKNQCTQVPPVAARSARHGFDALVRARRELLQRRVRGWSASFGSGGLDSLDTIQRSRCPLARQEPGNRRSLRPHPTYAANSRGENGRVDPILPCSRTNSAYRR